MTIKVEVCQPVSDIEREIMQKSIWNASDSLHTLK